MNKEITELLKKKNRIESESSEEMKEENKNINKMISDIEAKENRLKVIYNFENYSENPEII